jgi:hypothetical protein
MNFNDIDKKAGLILAGDYLTYEDHKFIIANINYTQDERKVLIRKMKLNKIFGDELHR